MAVLTTKRLLLRNIEENDFEGIHAYGSDPENVRFMLWGPNDENGTKEFIRFSINRTAKEPQVDYDFAFCLKESGELIGTGGIYCKDEFKEGSLGWILNKKYWKQGYGTEVAAELIRFGFEDLKLHRIYATCDSDNYGSYRVMERNHLRKEGHFIKNRDIRGEWRDEFLYAIIEDEWKACNKTIYK